MRSLPANVRAFVAFGAVAMFAIACQGRGGDGGGGGRASARDGAAPIDAGAGFGETPPPSDAAAAVEDAPRAKLDEPDPLPDPGKQIAELRAIPAWQAVIDRAQLLERRGQRGVVYGRLGAPLLMPGPAVGLDAGVTPPAVPSPYTWLIDDTEGNGALAIRVELGGHTAKLGDRVALAGAWALDADRRWLWKVSGAQALSPSPTPTTAAPAIPDPPAATPGHAIVDGRPPAGARTITVARDHDAVYFQLVGPVPTRDGDGWLVANELGDTPFARLTLPGERASYGGQDMRAPDERWHLKRGQTYWVRIGRIRSRGPDQPVTMFARTAPVRVN